MTEKGRFPPASNFLIDFLKLDFYFAFYIWVYHQYSSVTSISYLENRRHVSLIAKPDIHILDKKLSESFRYETIAISAVVVFS